MTRPPSPEPDPNQPIAGWYPDANLGQLRYWDGAAWTEHLTPYPEGDPGAPPPPRAADAITLGEPTPKTERLPALNGWIAETFRLTIDQAGHLFTLLVILTFPIDVIAAGVTWMSLRDLVVTIADDSVTVDGAGGWLIGAAAIFFLAIAAKIVLAASASRHVLAARTGVPESWSDTLGDVVVRLPRLLGSIVVFFGCFTLLYLVVFIPLGLVAAAAPFLGLFALLAAFIAILAGSTRIGFGPTMSIVAPPGQGGVRRSIALTKGATRPLLRRFAMLAMIGFSMIFATSLFTAPLLGGSADIATADDMIDFGEVVGDNAAAFGIGQIIGGLVAGAFAVLVGGGLGLLYADLGGPIDESITDVDPTGIPLPSSP